MNDLEREATLRRLLTEAVEPIQPAPDAQARLARRIRIGAQPRKPFWERAGFGWAATGLATAGIIVLAVLFVHVRGGDSSKSSSAASGGSASSATSNPAAQPQTAAAGASPEAHSPDLTVVTGDLDGDGQADTLSIAGGMLSAKLTQAGSQSVALPTTGPGARVLGITQFASYAGGRVPVVLVRLQERTGFAQDTVATLVGGRLTVLRIGSGPALLIVDASHGYACNENELVVSGNPAAYVVQGDQLVASPQLRAVTAPVGRNEGC